MEIDVLEPSTWGKAIVDMSEESCPLFLSESAEHESEMHKVKLLVESPYHFISWWMTP